VEPSHGDARAIVDEISTVGPEIMIEARLVGKDDGGPITIVLPGDRQLKKHQEIDVNFPREHLHVFDGKSYRIN
jgi:ABC-type sugar transport system ATPase subunit